jgi:hypothetical protein
MQRLKPYAQAHMSPRTIKPEAIASFAFSWATKLHRSVSSRSQHNNLLDPRFELHPVVYHSAKPFGTVVDYWMHTEFQARDSLHVYILLWTKELAHLPSLVTHAAFPPSASPSEHEDAEEVVHADGDGDRGNPAAADHSEVNIPTPMVMRTL